MGYRGQWSLESKGRVSLGEPAVGWEGVWGVYGVLWGGGSGGMGGMN